MSQEIEIIGNAKQLCQRKDSESVHLRQLLAEQFGVEGSLTEEKCREKFKQIGAIKFGSEKEGTLFLTAALMGLPFLESLRKITSTDKWRGNQVNNVPLMEVVLDNLSYNANGNPISDVLDNCEVLSSNRALFNETVTEFANISHARKLLFFETHKNKERRECVNKLGIRIVRGIKQNTEKSDIVEFKKNEIPLKVGKQQRHCYCYLVPRNENIDNFWILCVQSFEEAAKAEMISDDQLRRENYYIEKLPELNFNSNSANSDSEESNFEKTILPLYLENNTSKNFQDQNKSNLPFPIKEPPLMFEEKNEKEQFRNVEKLKDKIVPDLNLTKTKALEEQFIEIKQIQERKFPERKQIKNVEQFSKEKQITFYKYNEMTKINNENINSPRNVNTYRNMKMEEENDYIHNNMNEIFDQPENPHPCRINKKYFIFALIITFIVIGVALYFFITNGQKNNELKNQQKIRDLTNEGIHVFHIRNAEHFVENSNFKILRKHFKEKTNIEGHKNYQIIFI